MILSVNLCISLRHCSGNQVKVICTCICPLPAFYHMSVRVIAHPLSSTIRTVRISTCPRFLVDILAGCFFPTVHCIQPVPCITCRVIDFLAASIQSLPSAALVPVSNTILLIPLTVKSDSGRPAECTRNAVYRCVPLCHCSGCQIEIIYTRIRRLPALDHLTVCIVAHPFAGTVLPVRVFPCIG